MAEQFPGSAPPQQRVRDRNGRALAIAPGRPLPIGASETRRGLNFAVFSRHATAVTLVLFASGQHEPVLEVPLDAVFHRTGDLWHVEIEGLDTGTRYGWRADRQPAPNDGGHRFDAAQALLDPYAPAITGAPEWGVRARRAGEPPGHPLALRRSLYLRHEFEWDHIRPPRLPLHDKIIYELHVRGFTRHPSSGVAHPGSYRGLVEKIPYLQALGVTTVELLPVYDFDELDSPFINPETGERLKNFWGYNPIAFFAPKASYAVQGRSGGQVAEFKELVREFHRAGIEVFLDVVFNHTAENAGKPDDPTYSFRGLDNATYYILDPKTGAYRDFSGCGNTLNCNHPVVRGLIIDALRYWVAETHVDGFRFDLASVLGRGQDGEVLANPPLLERIAGDPVLAESMLIAEAWDAAGLYQVGRFPAWGRWAEWNGPYRDEVRRFVRGDAGLTGALAARLTGSADLFQRSGRSPCHSINFVTCHDGFTLADLVAYDRKHNFANGEDDRDGLDENFSWNCGVEGPTDEAEILALRQRQMRNMLTILMLSQGTPMLLAGDELGRTQRGNNNAYCQDNEISWVDWTLLDTNRDLFRFVQTLIAFRRTHSILRRPDFLTGAGTAEHPRPDVIWHGTRPDAPDWTPDARVLALQLTGEHATQADCDVYFAVNAWQEDLVFALPPPPHGTRWVRVVDTALPSPDDIRAAGEEAELLGQDQYTVQARACLVLRSK